MDEQTQATIPPKATPTPPVTAPGVPRPITVRLRPVAPGAGGGQSPVTPTTAGDAATVKLRPVTPPPSMTAPILAPGPAPAATVSTAQIAATIQAAKTKTSRISLDSAIGATASVPIAGGPEKNTTKTIRLKRPTDLESPVSPQPAPFIPANLKSATASIVLPPGQGVKPGFTPPAAPSKTSTIPNHKTSRIPDSAISVEPALTPPPPTPPMPAASTDSATVTQKKTLKIRRPGAPEPTVSAAAPSATAEGADVSLEGVAMTPISDLEAAPVSKGYKTFTLFAVIFASAAAIVMIVLNWCLAADVIAPYATKNTQASIQVDMQPPWPQKFVE